MDSVIDDAINFIKSFFENEFSGHDYFHSLRVYRTAVRLAEAEGADMRIVALAALLHDVDDVKLSPETYENKKNAVAFLKKEEVTDADIKEICRIIDEVSFNGKDSVTPSTLEGKCVQDADRLDALGAIGIARAFAYGGSHKREIYNPDIPPVMGMTKEEYRKHESSSINHFYEKLFLLKDMMNTETARRIAKEREAYMKAYVDEFMAEWDGLR